MMIDDKQDFMDCMNAIASNLNTIAMMLESIDASLKEMSMDNKKYECDEDAL